VNVHGLARARYLSEPLRPEDKRPLQFEPGLAERLPAEVTALTGAIRRTHLPQQPTAEHRLRRRNCPRSADPTRPNPTRPGRPNLTT